MKITANVNIQREITVETIEWLHQAWELLQKNQALQPDPFYKRNDKLTPEIVKDVLTGIEKLMLVEFEKFDGYHRRAQGGIEPTKKLVPPRFLKLSYNHQFAIVQGIDKIFQKHKVEEPVYEKVDPAIEGIAYG